MQAGMSAVVGFPPHTFSTPRPAVTRSLTKVGKDSFLSYWLKSCSYTLLNWKQKVHSYIFIPSSLCVISTVCPLHFQGGLQTSQNVGTEFLLVPRGSLVCFVFPPAFFFLSDAIS